MNCDTAKLHIISLLIFRVDMTIGLMNLKEVLNDRLIDIMANRIFDLFHIKIEFGQGTAGRMRMSLE